MRRMTEEQKEKMKNAAEDAARVREANRRNPAFETKLYKIVKLDDWNFILISKKSEGDGFIGYFPHLRDAIKYMVDHWTGDQQELKRAKSIEGLIGNIHQAINAEFNRLKDHPNTNDLL